MAIGGFAQITGGKCGENLTWSFDSETGTLTISGTGAMTGFVFYPPWYNYHDSISVIMIEDSVTSIADNAFSNFQNGNFSIKSVTIGNSVTNIGKRAFYQCLGLTSVTIGNSVTSIGDHAFFTCFGLVSINIPESVTSIGDYAFSDCYGLTSVTIPNNVTSIGDWVFNNCFNLSSIEVDSNNPLYASENGILFNKEKTTLTYCPEGKSGQYIIPESVTSIGDGAFRGCIYLTSIAIPNSVANIGDGAFGGCIYLTSIAIPNSVANIGDRVFGGCYTLSSVKVDWENPINISASVFYLLATSDITLLVPQGTSEAYRAAAVWQDFNIVEDGSTAIPIMNETPNVICIYPNPVSESFRISGISENTPITIIDMTGKIVLQQTVNPCETVLASNLRKGIYFVNARGQTLKMIKQ